MIMSFAGYSFCKPYSSSYAQVSFKSAFLRAHYPAEFIAALVSNQGGYYSTFAYLSEGRRMDLTILPPDINASVWTYTGARKTVRVGLMQSKGFGNIVKQLIAKRETHGLYRSLSDFLSRVKLEYAEAQMLIKPGVWTRSRVSLHDRPCSGASSRHKPRHHRTPSPSHQNTHCRRGSSMSWPSSVFRYGAIRSTCLRMR